MHAPEYKKSSDLVLCTVSVVRSHAPNRPLLTWLSAQMEEREAGMEAAWAAGDDYRLPMGRVDDALDTSGLQQASLDAAIPSNNRGFQMLQRMGWSQGKGLGAAEDGAARRPPPPASAQATIARVHKLHMLSSRARQTSFPLRVKPVPNF